MEAYSYIMYDRVVLYLMGGKRLMICIGYPGSGLVRNVR